MEGLAIAGLVVAVLLGAAVAVMGVMLNASRRRLAQAKGRIDVDQTDASSAMDVQDLSHAREIDQIDRDLRKPVGAGEVILFRITLENDRLSQIRLAGHNFPGQAGTVRFESALEHIHPGDRAMVRNAVIDAMTRQRPLELVYRLVAHGRDRYYHLHGKTLATGGAGSVDLLGSVTEITSLILAQRDQAEWTKVLEELNDGAPFGVWAFGADGVVTVWNGALEKMTGIPSEDVVGFDRNAIPDPAFAAVVRGTEDPNRENGQFKADVVTKDGLRRFKVTQVNIRRDAHVAHTFGIVETECHTGPTGKSGEMEALGKLTAGVAHDFANLVHIIMGYADIISQDLRDNERLLPPFLLDDLSQIQNAASRADDLVRQILVFCSRESLNTTSCDINDVVKRFIGLMTRILGENIALRFHPRQDLSLAVADAGVIERILLKLLLRVKETMPDGGVVAISTADVTVDPDWPVGDLDPADYVKLSVSTDTVGWGGEPGDEGAENDSESITQMMAAAGGKVNLHESPDLGTTVSLYFRSTGISIRTGETGNPIVAPTLAVPDLSSRLEFQPASRKGTILVVEDDTPVRRLTAKALAMAGHIVLEAADGLEAISVFNRDPERVDLLITDVIMPGMNGRQVCDELKRIRPDLPVLFCSGYSSDLLKNEYMLNIQGLVIQKPYRASDLVAAAAKLLAGSPAQTHEATGDAGNNTSW